MLNFGTSGRVGFLLAGTAACAFIVYSIHPTPSMQFGLGGVAVAPPEGEAGATAARPSAWKPERLVAILNTVVTLVVGFGAAVVGAAATRTAAARSARETIEAQRSAREEERDHERRLALAALRWELKVDLSLLESQSPLYRRVPLQNTALESAMHRLTDLPEEAYLKLQDFYVLAEQYNAITRVLPSADSRRIPEILEELERMAALGRVKLDAVMQAIEGGDRAMVKRP